MIRLTENIEKDLERWDKLGYIIISASISTTEYLHKIGDNGEELDELETDENGEPIRYLTDQYINSSEVIHGDHKGLDNGLRTNKLKKEIENSGFSFKKVWGVYGGEGEKSFMIFPMKIKDGEIKDVPFEELYDFGKKLVGDFTQYSVHVHKPGSGTATNDNYLGEVDDAFTKTRPSNKTDKDEGYMTSTVNPKKPSALNHSFSTDFNDYSTDFGRNHKLKKDHLIMESLFESVYNEAHLN